MHWRGSDIDQSRLERIAALVSAAALGALAVGLLVRLALLFLPDHETMALAAPRPGAEVAAAKVSISKWHLFGNTPARPGASANAPLAQLGFVLRGTLADDDASRGIAVIDRGVDGEHAYRAGEEIVPGVKLARVYADRVVVLHEGREESLVLPRDSELMPANIVRKSAPGTRSAATANRSGDAVSSAGTNPAPRNWQDTVERLRRHPEELAQRVQIVPVLDGGKLAGVRVSAGTDLALLNQLGLRPGDVVTQIDGEPVSSLAQGRGIVERLGQASRARVTVLRDGKPTDVTISLK